MISVSDISDDEIQDTMKLPNQRKKQAQIRMIRDTEIANARNLDLLAA